MELGGKRLALTKAGQKALNEARKRPSKRCGNIGSKQTGFDELRRIESIKGQTGKAKRSLRQPDGAA